MNLFHGILFFSTIFWKRLHTGSSNESFMYGWCDWSIFCCLWCYLTSMYSKWGWCASFFINRVRWVFSILCFDYHQIFIHVNLIHISTSSWTLFLLFLITNTMFLNDCFCLYTIEYIYIHVNLTYTLLSSWTLLISFFFETHQQDFVVHLVLIIQSKSLVMVSVSQKYCFGLYHEIFIYMSILHIWTISWNPFFYFFWKTHVPKMLFLTTIKYIYLYTCQSYIYELSHGILFLLLFLKNRW